MATHDSDIDKTIGDMVPPWIYNPETMNPLLVAYDQRIAELEQQNKEYQQKLTSMERDVREVIDENKNLHIELKDVMAKTVRKYESEDNIASFGGTFSIHSEDLREMQERIDLLDRENKLLLEEQTELQREMLRLREENRQMQEEHSMTNTDAGRVRQLVRGANKRMLHMQQEKENAEKMLVSFKYKVCFTAQYTMSSLLINRHITTERSRNASQRSSPWKGKYMNLSKRTNPSKELLNIIKSMIPNLLNHIFNVIYIPFVVSNFSLAVQLAAQKDSNLGLETVIHHHTLEIDGTSFPCISLFCCRCQPCS